MTILKRTARGALAAGFLFLAGMAAAAPIRLGIRTLVPAAGGLAGCARPDACPIRWTDSEMDLEALRRFPVAFEPPGVWTDDRADRLAELLKKYSNIESVLISIASRNSMPYSEAEKPARILDFRKVTALVRGLRPDVTICLTTSSPELAAGPPVPAAPGPILQDARALLEHSDLLANVDAVAISTDEISGLSAFPLPPSVQLWLEEPRSAIPLIDGLRAIARTGATRFIFSDRESGDFPAVLARAQAYLTSDVSPQPAPDSHSARFYDGKTLTPIVFVAGAGTAKLDVAAGGPYREAQVENLATGARRTFALIPGSEFLDLDLSKGPLAVRLIPARKPGEVTSQVTVGGEHALTAEEIIARERAWKAAQDDHVRSYTADLKTSLRFRIAEVNETFDLTIVGPLFKERGKDFDWAWEEFYVNGLKWKEKTLPKIPILQPEKVTTLPLEIDLSDAYSYALAGKTQLEGREVYEIDFAPKSSVGDKPLYKGRAWIDAKTFALVKRRSVQQNLRGETLSNVETEFYRPVASDPAAVLPVEIKGEEVFSTAGRTTDIERFVEMKHIKINPDDFEPRRKATYASPSQIVRDTPRGLKYLVPDPERPGDRIVEEYVSKRNLFGIAGFFYDGALSYPIPLLGIQYFNFDLWKKGKQISVFFGGAVLTTNYTDPAFLGSRFDVGADVYGFAFPFGDSSYHAGKEVKAEKVKHLPAAFQLNLGHPIGPYLKASIGLFTKYDNYQRDQDTASDFITPADTETFGLEAKLSSHINGFNTTLDYSKFHRNSWPFWGIPGSSEYQKSQRDYEKYSLEIAKDYYLSGFKKIHAAISYLGGDNLDRFSRYEFGAFSGNPIRGYNSGSLRTKEAWVMNLSYGLNIEDLIRLEGVYDQAMITDRVSGFRHQYYSGAGISGQLTGPWKNSLIRFDIGFPVVSHGIHGVSASALILKLF
jgi:hypothetical protein